MSLLVSPCFCAKLFFFIPDMIERCIVEIVELLSDICRFLFIFLSVASRMFDSRNYAIALTKTLS